MTDRDIPGHLSYTTDHEWIDLAPGATPPETPVRIGITSVAVEALGDLVFIQLPEVGDTISAGDNFGEIESTKTVSDLIAPVSGEVVEINAAVVEDPAVIGTDPYGAGWLVRVRVDELGALLSAAEYSEQSGQD
ncbi:Glycine cleavage system H protein [Mycobacterium basiliense]|uniref:Glycine cleavage system H protein n=1 Tax=Mycobacterium basiliense TaxID=2094119 RepID=A0A447G8C2_9MYCO|nr:glycine cleavage system protein GcvH [Mycobacterium basiliense]VDM86621.1 Glycine cleavage system H protein [Mycobacterium basiliense]